ncbi:DUF3800 domain-containing protein [Paracoccus sp. (in: a-proteobacteria)]|uniref:DUF3800 domain-containing protein n=1 Tax=Paracoccus sp. TaxID=267 RepID=UPI003A86F55C
MTSYVFYADESGNVTQEPGISDEVGPSRYLSMGGCLIKKSELRATNDVLDRIREKFRKKNNLHATDLSHVQKLYLIGEIIKIGMPFFGVVSDKNTLRGFKEKSEGNPQDYYNRTALYLLSLLGRYLKKSGIDCSGVEIVFEERTHDYKRLGRYIRAVQRKPTGDGVDGITRVSANNIRAQSKNNEHLFAIPDILAHGIFSAFDRNRNNFGITECRYLQEMMQGFCHNGQAERFHLIKSERMQDICDPTIKLMAEYGLKIGEQA